MNEQINKLINEAGTDVSGKWMSIDNVERFALLIVKECQKLNSKELSITAIERLLPLCKEHFGIEP